MTYTVESLPAVLAVVDGEPCHTHWDDGDERCCVCGARYPVHMGPDQFHLPRSWEGIDLTCQTCHGLTDAERQAPCDCVDGHPIIDVAVESQLHGVRVRRTVRVSIQAVPIEHHSTGLRPAHICIAVDDDGSAALWTGDGDVTPITLPPGTRPGQLAIIAQEVDR